MGEYIKRIIDKALSARFLVTMLLTLTFCIITVKSFTLLAGNLGNEKNLPLIEKILFFILGSFCTQVGNVITSYFDRSDRKKEGEGK